VPYTTTQGRKARHEYHPNGQKLTPTEEYALEDCVISLDK